MENTDKWVRILQIGNFRLIGAVNHKFDQNRLRIGNQHSFVHLQIRDPGAAAGKKKQLGAYGSKSWSGKLVINKRYEKH